MDVMPLTSVDCGTCTACCKKMLILLEPGLDDPAAYDCDVMKGPRGLLYSVKHRANGDCIYLGPHGCTIHGHQPAVCRAFDCVAFVRDWPRARRRKEGKRDNDEVLKAGLSRLAASRRVGKHL